MSAKASGLESPDKERSLDPEDWEELRQLGHQAFDDMLEYLKSVATRPAWQPLPSAAKQLFEQDTPRQGMALGEVYEQIRDHILPYPTGNIHPRFWLSLITISEPTSILSSSVAVCSL